MLQPLCDAKDMCMSLVPLANVKSVKAETAQHLASGSAELNAAALGPASGSAELNPPQQPPAWSKWGRRDTCVIPAHISRADTDGSHYFSVLLTCRMRAPDATTAFAFVPAGHTTPISEA